MIIPIVLHKVVESRVIDFEDINRTILNKIFSDDPNKYITVDNLDYFNEQDRETYYLVTFDDGYLSDYSIVFPKLKELNIRATFFINPQVVGLNGYLSWDMIREMSDYGMCFGSHSDSHPDMTVISSERVEKEFVNSKVIISNEIGKDINAFSFPFGFYDFKLVKCAINLGYKKCFISDHGIYKPDKLIIPRNSINSTMDAAHVEKILQCSKRTRLKWELEDLIKRFLKRTFGINFYKKLRNIIL